MPNPVHAHIPYPQLRNNLELVLQRNHNLEVMFTSDALDAMVPEELSSIAGMLAARGLRTTIHAPFMDLNPGAFDPLVRKATLHRFHQVLDAASILKPVVVVFHPGYDKWRFGESQDRWLHGSTQTFREVLDRAVEIGCIVAVENIFEEEPSTLKALLEEIDSPMFRHCFDIGHWNMFKKVGMREWFDELGGFIAEAHIHDNHGKKDEHLPLGEGAIDFDLFFSMLRSHAPDAVCTIEAHSIERLDRALVNIGKYIP